MLARKGYNKAVFILLKEESAMEEAVKKSNFIWDEVDKDLETGRYQ